MIYLCAQGWVNSNSKRSFFFFFFIILSWGRLVDTSYLLCKHSRTKLPLTHRSTAFRPLKPKTVVRIHCVQYTAELDACIQCAAINILLRFYTIYIFHSTPLCCPDRITFVFIATIDFFFATVYSKGAGVLNYYQPLKFRFNINWSVGKSLIFLVQCYRGMDE